MDHINSQQLSNKDKFKALAKQAAISAAMNVVPGPVAFMLEMGQKVYELWGTATPAERESFIEGASGLSSVELDQLQAELAQETGVDDRAVVELVVQSVRGIRGTGEDEALRSINAQLHQATNGQATITPQGQRQHSRAMSTLLGVAQRGVDLSGRASWPQVEGFELSAVLGRGAAGVVYLAKQTAANNRTCALKVGQLESASRFEREVRAMGAVNHINLIDLWGSGQLSDPPRYWIAMPNVGGLTLADLWRQDSLALPERLRLLGEVLAGLSALHQANLAHRDLKPANALVTPTLSVRLADFGLSKDAVKTGEATMTATSMGLEGTPAYMSPEQVREDRLAGAEVDVWAFGVMLYEVLKGERPFKGSNLMVLGGQILNQTLDVDGEWVPTELKSVLQKSLERDRSKRYPNAIVMEQPYQQGAGRIIERYAHEALRQAWNFAEQGQVFIQFSSLEALQETGQETWQKQLVIEAQDRLSQGFTAINEWRQQRQQAEATLTDLQAQVSAQELESLTQSVTIAHQALANHPTLLAQWQAWHRGLKTLEYNALELKAKTEAQQLKAQALASMAPTMHQALTAWGRAPYNERQQAQTQAQTQVNDIQQALAQRCTAMIEQVALQELGQERQQTFDAGKVSGKRQGKAAAKSWITELEQQVAPQRISEAQARQALATRAQAWRSLPTQQANHDQAGEAWRNVLANGSLAQYCLDHALNLPTEPHQDLTQLRAVSPRRVAEVVSKGIEHAISTALVGVQHQEKNRLADQLNARLNQKIQQKQANVEGVSRLQQAGHIIGFEQGFRQEVEDFVTRANRGRELVNLESINQALRTELAHELRAHEELVAEQRLASAKRRKWVLLVSAALCVALGLWVMNERAEQARLEAAAKAEQAHAELDKLLTFIKIPAGTFQMGSTESSDEQPIHTVSVKAFLMSETEVTVAQYRKCVEAGVCTEPDTCNWGNPIWTSKPSAKENHPINCVDWGQARTFAVWAGGDLPTEAQWEYAARGGKNYKYAGSNDADAVAWYSSNSGGSTHQVKTKKPNGYGLYDMSGNVWEWALDEWHGSYKGAPSSAEGVWGDVGMCSQRCDRGSSRRVFRGGSWSYYARVLRVAYRGINDPGARNDYLGFRIRRTLP